MEIMAFFAAAIVGSLAAKTGVNKTAEAEKDKDACSCGQPGNVPKQFITGNEAADRDERQFLDSLEKLVRERHGDFVKFRIVENAALYHCKPSVRTKTFLKDGTVVIDRFQNWEVCGAFHKKEKPEDEEPRQENISQEKAEKWLSENAGGIRLKLDEEWAKGSKMVFWDIPEELADDDGAVSAAVDGLQDFFGCGVQTEETGGTMKLCFVNEMLEEDDPFDEGEEEPEEDFPEWDNETPEGQADEWEGYEKMCMSGIDFDDPFTEPPLEMEETAEAA